MGFFLTWKKLGTVRAQRELQDGYMAVSELASLWYAKNLVWHVSQEELVLVLCPFLPMHSAGWYPSLEDRTGEPCYK